MAWERRGYRLYYYRKERTRDGVKSEYAGRGEHARLFSSFDQMHKSAAIKPKAADDAARQIDEALDEIGDLNRNLVDALFLLTGHHQHKRQWRRKRK